MKVIQLAAAVCVMSLGSAAVHADETGKLFSDSTATIQKFESSITKVELQDGQEFSDTKTYQNILNDLRLNLQKSVDEQSSAADASIKSLEISAHKNDKQFYYAFESDGQFPLELQVDKTFRSGDGEGLLSESKSYLSDDGPSIIGNYDAEVLSADQKVIAETLRVLDVLSEEGYTVGYQDLERYDGSGLSVSIDASQEDEDIYSITKNKTNAEVIRLRND